MAINNSKKSGEQNKKSEFISVRIDQITKQKLEKLAKQEDRTLSWIVSNILDKHVLKK